MFQWKKMNFRNHETEIHMLKWTLLLLFISIQFHTRKQVFLQADILYVDLQLPLSAVSVCPSGNTSVTQNSDCVYTSGDKSLRRPQSSSEKR